MSRTKLPPTLLCDFYKLSHRKQYPKGTEVLLSNWTPRGSRLKDVTEVVSFGFQAFTMKYLINYFNEHFFNKPLEQVVEDYARVVKYALGEDEPDVDHIKELHGLGFIPVEIRAIKEGRKVPLRIPMMTIENTHGKQFSWVTNNLETIMSLELWMPMTSATIANQYREILEDYAMKTSGAVDAVQFQGHDFSMRGMAGLDAAKLSGMGHLLNFVGTDTIPAILAHEEFYGANIEKELVGCSIPATEHSVMCSLIFYFLERLQAGESCLGISLSHYPEKTEKEIAELVTVKHLITEVYPSGLFSIVSDTFDLWNVLTFILPQLEEEIMGRDGKVVIRPDSGDPASIICGRIAYDSGYEGDDYDVWMQWTAEHIDDKLRDETPHGECGGELELVYKFNGDKYNVKYSPDWNRHDKQYYYIDNYDTTVSNCTFTKLDADPERAGVIELLYDTFGGIINSKGFIELDSHVGAIYGDAITIDRTKDICKRLMDKGFASTNIVLGIGSYTYQHNTRDTLGFALKSTYVKVDNSEIQIYKDPITDDGLKKSAKGMVVVLETKDNQLYMVDELNAEEREKHLGDDQLKTIFKDGVLTSSTTLAEIREEIRK